MKIVIALAAAAGLLAANGARAATNLLNNGSFELQGIDDPGAVVDWGTFNVVEAENTLFTDPSPKDGTYYAYFGDIYGSIGQEFAVVPGRLYTVTFWLQLASVSPDTFVAQVGPTEITVDTSTRGWTEYSFNFTGASGGTDGLFFVATGGSGAALDEVSVFADSPEPATWALMLAGFAGLGAMLRQRRAIQAP